MRPQQDCARMRESRPNVARARTSVWSSRMEKIAIVGCGLVGRAWSMVFARAGHEVKLYDAVPGVVDQAVGLIREGLEELRKAGLVAESPEAILKRIRTTRTLAEAVGDADYVQESTA